MEGIIFDIKEMSLNDGPGIRTTVFFKGCPLRCRWCHNPEGISFQQELKQAGPPCLECGLCYQPCNHIACQAFQRCLQVCPQGRLHLVGERLDVATLAARIKNQAAFLLEHGGVTISGGEPLAQPDFLLALLRACKPLHLTLDTACFAPANVFQAACHLADLLLVDIKLMDEKAHRYWTGVSNQQILANLAWLKQQDIPFIARIPLIAGVNDDLPNLTATARFLAGSSTLLQVELLPYNVLTGSKYAQLGLDYEPGFKETVSSADVCAPFQAYGLACRVM